tara:strand:- start:150 stop:887 length:738 start_codon:yes stop_codon:yes gene_type:complete
MFSEGIHNTSFVMLSLIIAFAVIHSGGAAIRTKAEKFLGARAWRLIFASLSIPSAVLLVGYFLAHRYDGIRLWNLQGMPGIIQLIWVASAISFLFLYPATYNLLEIPALSKPTIRLYAKGIIRISRHPQAIGQIIWCIAHGLWIGSSFMVVTCAGLIAHHLFAVWHGDRRLKNKFGSKFEELKKNTSVIPFVAVIDGRQKLEWKEFLRPSQLGICIAIALFWWSHRFISFGAEVFISSYFSELFA